jgi:hypothetical protein
VIWTGTTTGVLHEVRPAGQQWQLRVGQEWFTTKAHSPVNQVITGGMTGQIVRVHYEKTKNPKDRRVHHIETDAYPTLI